MTQSTNAILCFGVLLSNEENFPWDELGDFDEWCIDKDFTLVRHGHCNDPEYILCLSNMIFKAYRGYPESINVGLLDADDDLTLADKMLDFCKLHDIKIKEGHEQAEWWLCSFTE